jgi:LysM repeat protein
MSQPQPPPCPEGNLYTIRLGDTFFSIARRFRISVDDLREANPGVDPDNLQVGQIICIPLAVPPIVCPPGTFTYTVRAGDTFFSIARRFGTTVDALIRANPGVDPDALLIGQQICVPGAPGPEVCPPGTFVYVVRLGDTFFGLARRFNTTVEAIQQANPFVDPDNLRVGQILCIPGVAPPVCPAGTMPYIIRAGDTYFSLARRFNTTVEAITAANPGVDPNNLQIGQTICIPG